MDFLPHPTSGVEPLDIPFVADTPYVFGSDFWDFPKLHGFGDQWASLPAPRLASLAQSWLYFGTISEFLGRPIDYREFQVSRSVSGKPLLPLLDEWLAAHALPVHGAATQDAELLEERKQVLYEHVRFLDAVIQLAENFDGVSQGHVKPIPTIILSVKVLCTTLRSVVWDLARGDIEQTLRPWPSPATRMRREIIPAADSPGRQTLRPGAQLMLDVLRLRGWCPFYARRVLTSHNYALVYYFTRLFRTYSPGLSHHGCTDDECVAGNADIFSYVPKHARRGCLCQPKSAPMDQIRAIIEDGGIPLVRLRGSPKTGVRIEVARMTARTRFVVVSHVWSDGIGNAHTNALPECQLRRLKAHMSQLKPLRRSRDPDVDFNLLTSLDTGFQTARQRRPKYLWIDALCMPPGGTTAFLRLRAINKLPAVYQAADRILVLDSTLERTSMVDSDSLELFARFSVSPWMGRCWTFQEAALASACEVQCSDGTFDAFSPQIKQKFAASPATVPRRQAAWLEAATAPATWISRKLSRKSRTEPMQLLGGGSSSMGADSSTAIMASLTRSLSEEFRSTFANGVKPSRSAIGEGKLAPDFCTLFVQVWNELSKRATTVPGDMHIIMASLLGFHTEPIMRLPKLADRMSCILRSMDGIPVSLLFNLDGPRHNPTRNHRDRWLPLYPSRQRLAFGSPFTNLRCINDDLHLPNNTVSRQKVAVLVCSGETDPFSSCTFTLRDTTTGEQYAVAVHRQEGEMDEFATPEIGPYVIAIQLEPELGHRPDGHIDGLDAVPRTFAGALLRVRRVVTNVRRLYYHALESEYDKSFELIEDEAYGERDLETASKRTTNYLDGNLAAAFSSHLRGILRTVYDCPLTISCVPDAGEPIRSPLKEGPTLLAQPLPETWQVVIEREPPTYPVPLPSRPSFAEAITPVSAYLIVTALDGLVASGCVGLAIAICATMFFRLATIARATIIAKLILHSLFLIQMFIFPGIEVRLIWDVPHLALVALYAFSRVTTTGASRMDVLDWSFIAWAFLGHTVDFLARLSIQWFVVPALFKKHLASFDSDAFRDQGRGKGSGRYGMANWYHRARLKLRGRFGRTAGYQEQQVHSDGMPGYGRLEQHLLGDMEGQV
ncbi:68a87d7a-986c-4f96-9767-af43a3a43bdb [Thermothielavioides terrestris]|uniref:68a87d7a-986c-4f96-9767-af43a3a43bdb n=1 Tax=Thermothielavioides terrestris TaxID=2587410 RepID=A0A3S4F2F0_9PEZI|nr:68a87d7a-986c-4f96-9767-af43a3a43bdb [Thermothielavioides terrestris]